MSSYREIRNEARKNNREIDKITFDAQLHEHFTDGAEWLLCGITQLKAQGPSETCNESEDKEEEDTRHDGARPSPDIQRGTWQHC